MNEHQDQPAPDAEDNIPELTQVIPTVDQIIPELTERIDLDTQPQAKLSQESAANSVEAKLHEQRFEQDAPAPKLAYSVTMDSISNHELEQQQWQIEQLAQDQAGAWQEVGAIPSMRLALVSDNRSESEQTSQMPMPELTDEQQQILEASWQRLETILMQQMPSELAGAYLRIMQKTQTQNQAEIAAHLDSLDSQSLDDLLDFFDLNQGF